MKNSFGMDPHITDQYIWWGDKNKEKKAEKLRAAYDKLNAVDPDALEVLLEASYDSGVDNTHEEYAGP